jgi:hypothetical protein
MGQEELENLLLRPLVMTFENETTTMATNTFSGTHLTQPSCIAVEHFLRKTTQDQPIMSEGKHMEIA